MPRQGKAAVITPVATRQAGAIEGLLINLSDEYLKNIVGTCLNPALHGPPTGPAFVDQFAFKATGSTGTSTDCAPSQRSFEAVESTNDYDNVFNLDFTKAFDAVRRATMMEKMAQLSLSDNIYSWTGGFF